jgi:8-oxo-dGTP pyrophosphatase MutT (NUDIX family)
MDCFDSDGCGVEYRPTGVFVLYRGDFDSMEFLIVKSAKESGVWMFPQGGIMGDEDVVGAFYRELFEELGIEKCDVRLVFREFHRESVDIRREIFRRDGFRQGKHYVFSLGEYLGGSDFVLKRDEVVDAKWVGLEDAGKYLNKQRLEILELAVYALKRYCSK